MTTENPADPADNRILEGDEPRIQKVLDSFPYYVLMVDSEHKVVMANQCLYDTFQMRPEDVIGVYCPTAIHGLESPYPGCPVEEAHLSGASVERELFDEATSRWLMSAAYLTGLQTASGKPIYLHVVRDITEQKKADEALEILRSSLEETVVLRTRELESANRELQREVQERKRAEERIRQLAYYDHLTGLPNRTNFSELLASRIAEAEERGDRLGLALLDLDGFKSVNDSIGHDAGDLLLRLVARRLEEATRGGDIAARMGGDEFLFVFTRIEEPEDVEAIGQRLLDVFAEPFTLDGTRFTITASIGGAVYPDDGRDEVTLMKRADLSMYRAKNSGRNRFCRLPADGRSADAGAVSPDSEW